MSNINYLNNILENQDQNKSYVKKRNNIFQEMDFGKIQTRLKYLAQGYSSKENRNIFQFNETKSQEYILPQLNFINIFTITKKVVESIVNNISTNEIDEVAARICTELSHIHPDYEKLSSRIIISNHHKNTRIRNFYDITEYLYFATTNDNKKCPLVSKEYYKFVEKNAKRIEELIDYSRDYNLTYFGFKTLEKSYLLKNPKDKNPIERPQDMWMRVAIALNMHYTSNKLWKCIKTTYDYMSQGYYTHASPTLFNAGAKYQQMLSCFLMGSTDSLQGIMKTSIDIAKISKRSGGIGFHFNWRSSDSLIKGTGGKSSGPIPFLQIYDKILCAFNQGGKRKGSGAAYMSIDHPDIVDFIECRLPHKKIEHTTPDLFLAVAVRDLFMKRTINNENWSLFDPNECPGLDDLYGDEYEKLYIKYENENKAKKVIKARKLSENLAKCRLESGMPYIYFIDMANRKSNQKNLGTIRSSNLCSEIVEYSSADEYACCVLASICLPTFTIDTAPNLNNSKLENLNNSKLENLNNSKLENLNNSKLENLNNLNFKFNFKKLVNVVRIAFRNLNRVIDINDYPVIETKLSNMKHRPIGLGVQGLGDLYNKLKISYDSDEAKDLNKKIFETIYYATMTESCELAREKYLEYKKIFNEEDFIYIPKDYVIKRKFINEENGEIKEHVESTDILYPKGITLPTICGAYSSYKESPMSEGKFQFDLWDEELDHLIKTYPKFSEYNEKVKLSGMWDWESLRQKIKKFGVRNSLTVALMPTASTAQIMGNSEACEPITSNIYRRDVLSGQFICINEYLRKDCININKWSSALKDNIINNNGSIQQTNLPFPIKDRYKTVWELSQKAIIDQASDRGPYVDQSQSMNLFLGKSKKNISAITSMNKYAWMKRLKTGCYYLRTQDINDPQKFSVVPNQAKLENYNDISDNSNIQNSDNFNMQNLNDICTIQKDDICMSCSG